MKRVNIITYLEQHWSVVALVVTWIGTVIGFILNERHRRNEQRMQASKQAGDLEAEHERIVQECYDQLIGSLQTDRQATRLELQELRAQVAQLRGDWERERDRADRLQVRVKELEERNAGLEQEVRNLRAQNESLQKKVGNLGKEGSK